MDGDGIPSIDKSLGAMESEELFRLRDHLRDLAATPGWTMLLELVDVQHRRSETLAIARGHWTPQGLDGLIRLQAMEGNVAGYLKGLATIAAIVEKVEKVAETVERQLDQEARDG